MKKIILILMIFLTSVILIGCKSNELDLNLLSKCYNEEETNSFNNYISNKLDVAIYNDNTFLYEEEMYQINKDNSISKLNKKEEEYQNQCENLNDLLSFNIGDIVYVTSLDYAYQLTSSNLGFDIKLKDDLYASPLVNKGVLNIKAFGNLEDYADIMQNIFNHIADYKISTLELNGKILKCNHYLDLSGASNFSILGHGATLRVDDSFLDNDYHEFFFNIYNTSNIFISNLNLNYEMTRKINGIKTMLGLHKSNKFELVDANFFIPNSVPKKEEYTNMDLYTNWEDVIINKCSFINLCDNDAGGSLWIRDFHGLGSKNVKVLNSKFNKICHDELVAVFMGSISDVLIKNNEFIVPDDGKSSSVMNFTLGTSKNHQNISFIGNKVDCASTGGLIWAKGENVIIKDNELNIHVSKKSSGSFRAIEGGDNNIEEFSNNKVNVDSYLENSNIGVRILKNINKVSNNKIEVNLSGTSIFENIETISNNSVYINSNFTHIFYNALSNISNNEVEIKGFVESIFRFYNLNLKNDILIQNNDILYDVLETTNSTFIMLNDLDMNQFKVNFIENTLKATGINEKSRFLFYAPNDLNQTSIFKNNNVIGFNTNNNYFKNFNMIYE